MTKATFIFAVEYTRRPIMPADKTALEAILGAENSDYQITMVGAPHAEGMPGKIWVTDTDSAGLHASNSARTNYARIHANLKRELARRNMLVQS